MSNFLQYSVCQEYDFNAPPIDILLTISNYASTAHVNLQTVTSHYTNTVMKVCCHVVVKLLR